MSKVADEKGTIVTTEEDFFPPVKQAPLNKTLQLELRVLELENKIAEFEKRVREVVNGLSLAQRNHLRFEHKDSVESARIFTKPL